MTFTSTTSRLYTIEVNTDLTMPLNWTDSGLGVFAPDAGRNYTQCSAGLRDQAFLSR